MKIDFYEGFVSEKALSKLKLVDFPTRVFIAARSFTEFKKYEKIALKYNKNVRCGYWMIAKNSYWLSVLSNTKDLLEVFKEAEKCDNDILIDLEFPLFNTRMMIWNWIHFTKNKRLIKDFIKNNNKRVTIAQYPFKGIFLSILMKFFGLDFDDVEKNPMWYTSKLKGYLSERFFKDLENIKNKKNYSVGVGVIAKAPIKRFRKELSEITAKGNESVGIGKLGEIVITKDILVPHKLETDLKKIKKAGFKRVIVFRLEGLNKDYIKVLKKFI